MYVMYVKYNTVCCCVCLFCSQQSKEKVPRLNLSIGPMSGSQYSTPNDNNTSTSTSSRTDARKRPSSTKDSSCKSVRTEERCRHLPLHSPRRTTTGTDSEEVPWDEQLLQKATSASSSSSSSTSKSPRASVLKDSLKYAQSSKDSSTTTRVVYQQQKPSTAQFRSESAKAR
jgi:hypothetical protein